MSPQHLVLWLSWWCEFKRDLELDFCSKVSQYLLPQVMQGLAKAIAWDGEGATCLIEVCIVSLNLASNWSCVWNLVIRLLSLLCRWQWLVQIMRQMQQRLHALLHLLHLSRHDISATYLIFSLCWFHKKKNLIHCQKWLQSAVYGRDPNWGRIAAAAGYAGVPFLPNSLQILLGDILLMDEGQPLPFDR